MKNGLIIDEYGTKLWYKDDLLHRTDGPAVIGFNGYEFWHFEGKPHRADGPAAIYAGIEEWWFEGKLHRTDGPAVIYPDGTKRWYFNDKELTYEDWVVVVTSAMYENWLICRH
jgi:hypothetical protein